MHRYVSGLGNQIPFRVKNSTGKVPSFLYVGRKGGSLKDSSHFLRYKGKAVGKDLQKDGGNPFFTHRRLIVLYYFRITAKICYEDTNFSRNCAGNIALNKHLSCHPPPLHLPLTITCKSVYLFLSLIIINNKFSQFSKRGG